MHASWRGCVVAAVLLAAMSPAVAQGDAGIAALAGVSKLQQAKDHAQALDSLNGLIKGGTLTPDLTAKAMLMRGESHEKLGKPAFAMSDFDAALWLQGLSPSERTRASDGRRRVMVALGLADGKDAPPASSGAQDSGSGFFGNLFGSSSAAKPAEAKPAEAKPAEQRPATAPETTAAVARPRPPTTGWSASTQPTAAPTKAAAAAPRPADAVYIKLSLAPTAERAAAEVKRLAAKHQGALAGRAGEVRSTVASGGAPEHSVVFGPYASRAEAQGVCDGLKARQQSCTLAARN